jgi:hypothetical protein
VEFIKRKKSEIAPLIDELDIKAEAVPLSVT